MKTVIIGGTGHIGTYLVPWLVDLGYEVVSVSRQERSPYQPNAAWDKVTWVSIDRVAAERAGDFGDHILALAYLRTSPPNRFFCCILPTTNLAGHHNWCIPIIDQ